MCPLISNRPATKVNKICPFVPLEGTGKTALRNATSVSSPTPQEPFCFTLCRGGLPLSQRSFGLMPSGMPVLFTMHQSILPRGNPLIIFLPASRPLDECRTFACLAALSSCLIRGFKMVTLCRNCTLDVGQESTSATLYNMQGMFPSCTTP